MVWSKGNGGRDKAGQRNLYDLSTGKRTQLTDDYQSGQPQIRGDWMAWRQGFETLAPL